MSSLNNTAVSPAIGIIANSTSWPNRALLVKELGESSDGFFPPLKFTFKEMKGEIIPLDIQPNEVLTVLGMRKGKKALYNAVKYLAGRGVKVIMFTASTKRLPGRCGAEIKKMYPDITFSIGDNATMVSYLAILDHFLMSEKFDKENDEIVCMGAGFLGLKSIEHILANGCKKITIVSEQKLCLPSQVKVIECLEKLPKNIKMFLSCSHKYQINPLFLRDILNPEAILIDVAVPPGINYDTFISLPKTISRYDAGDFYLVDIHYEFPPEILSFPTVGFWYGCFTEGVDLAIARTDGKDLKSHNFFEINQENYNLINAYLHQEKVSVPLINFFLPEKAIKFISF